MKEIKLKFRLPDSEFMTAVRLVVGAVCNIADTDVDSCEDMKVCVTESCILLKDSGYAEAELILGVTPPEKSSCGCVLVNVKGYGGTPSVSENGYSLALISALVTSCDIERENGVISSLSLKL